MNSSKAMMPPILAGIIAVYGLVVAVLISGQLKEKLPLFTAFMQLAAGISVGLCGVAAGYVESTWSALQSGVHHVVGSPLVS